MILLCPFCGYKLNQALYEGISSCESCRRIFDTSEYHKILSASWICRHWHVDAATAQKHCGLTDPEKDIVDKYVCVEGFCHDDFLKILPSL
jgi:Zn-finger nucleic acid-binding protein